MKTFTAVCILGFAALAACASLSGAVAPQVASAVAKYCQEPLAERQVIRTQVNGMIAPATIKVTCANDPQ